VPLDQSGVVRAEYVLSQQGKDVGWERASWRADPSSEGWVLRSEGEMSIGPFPLSFRQETVYGADGFPRDYEMRAVAAGDSQLIRLETAADSVHMEVRVQGRWHERSLALPEPFAVMDNFLTSQTQMALWTHDDRSSRVVHAAVPQRLLIVPATVKRDGDFMPGEPETEDRGQPMPVGVPADAVDLLLGPVPVHLAVGKEGGWILQASVPSQGVRFELRKLSREIGGGSEVLYEARVQTVPAPEGFREIETAFESDGLEFTGTLCLPDSGGPFPVVLMLQGSGPHDRDETIGPNAPFRDIAHGLARRGIATFRYDKRTYLHAQELDPLMMTLDDEVIRDAEEALRHLAGRPEVRGGDIFVLGHSLGGTAAPLLEPPPGGIRGIVLMAAMGRPFVDVLRSQITYLADLARSDGRMPPEEEARTTETLRQIDDLAVGRLPRDEIVLGMPASYIEDIDRRDVAAGAAFLGAPLLILQGEKDYQVTTEDARLLDERFGDAGLRDVTVKVYPDLGHLFLPVEGTPGPRHYEKPGKVSAEVIDDIARWIRAAATRP
jgi:dienelactone hydrolase